MSESGVGIVPAELAGLILETLLTGVSLVSFAGATYVLAYKRGMSFNTSPFTFNEVFWLCMVVILATGVTHWVLNVNRAFDAFVRQTGDFRGPLLVFSSLTDATRLVDTGLYLLECYLADCIVVFRLYLICSRTIRVVIAPILGLLGILVCDVGIIYYAQTMKYSTAGTAITSHWVASTFIISLCTNLYCCAMVSYRLWKANRQVKVFVSQEGSLFLLRALHSVLESSAMYTIFTVTTFVAYLVQSNVYTAVVDTASPSINIVFCLMVVRSELSPGRSGSSTTGTGISDNTANIRLSAFVPARHDLHYSMDISDEPSLRYYEPRSLTGRTAPDLKVPQDVFLSDDISEQTRNGKDDSLEV